MTNLLWLLLFGFILLLLLVLITASVVGLVHAIRTSIKKHRRPPVLAMVGWGFSLLAIGLYIVVSRVIPSYGLLLFFWGHMHAFWRTFVQCVAIALPIISTAVYVYDSYRLPDVTDVPMASAEDGEMSTDSDEAGDRDEEEEEEEDEEEREERLLRDYQQFEAERRSRLGRILTLAVCLCLAGSLVGFILYARNSVIQSSTEEITEVRSPRDGRVIYIEKLRVKYNGYKGVSGELIAACAYERINPLCVARLSMTKINDDGSELTGTIFAGNFTQEEIEKIDWVERGFLIPYEKQWVEYRFYGIDLDSGS